MNQRELNKLIKTIMTIKEEEENQQCYIAQGLDILYSYSHYREGICYHCPIQIYFMSKDHVKYCVKSFDNILTNKKGILKFLLKRFPTSLLKEED